MAAMRLPPPLADAPLVSDWIRFDPVEGFVILSGRVELGQGNLTALLQMAADELGVAPADLRIVGADTTRTPNEGFTAGSMSVPFGGMAIRFAASAFRRLALGQAAQRLGCDPDELSVASGRILRSGRDSGLAFGDVAGGISGDVPVAEHADPKPPAERRLAGSALDRIDLEERIVGAPFVHDMTLPGMLHGRAMHPRAAGGMPGAVDLDALRARPGVLEVVHDGAFIGVVAERARDASAAADWLHARTAWSVPEVVEADPLRAIAASNAAGEGLLRTGDAAAAEGENYEFEASRRFLSHGSIGPSAAVAVWREGRLTVWTHSQGVFPLRQALALVFHCEPGAIDVIHRPGAGCYGHNGADDAALDAALLARAVPGRPVKVVWSRADEFTLSPLGAPMRTRARAVVGADGRLSALQVSVRSAPHSNRPSRDGAPGLRAAAYLSQPMPSPPPADLPLARGGGASRNAIPLYVVPNADVDCALVSDLPWRTSSLRSLGAFVNVYAIECLMDRVAAERGEDPVEFRLRHLDDPRARAVIEGAASDAADLMQGAGGDGEGWGLGFARYKNIGAYCAIVARVRVDEDVRVTALRACADIGEVINPDGARNQIEGGMIQSMSWTLKESMPIEGGRVAAESWLDYPIVTFSEVPETRVRLIARPEEPPLGAGEASQGPTAAALGNAVRHALGQHVPDLPLTRDAIMRALL